MAVEPERYEDTHAASGAPRHFYEGYLAEVLAGDVDVARAAYESVTGAGAEEPHLTAQALLRLAEYEALARRRRAALDLVARAAALGGDDPRLVEWAERLRAQLSSTLPSRSAPEVRGPAAGTALGVSSVEAAAAFARAEELLDSYHRRRLNPRLEQLRATVRTKRVAMEAAVRAYRDVVSVGDPTATVAAEFRIASLYYDISLALTFDLPSELDREVAATLRQSLRHQAELDRRKARAAYIRSLQAAEGAGPQAASWSEAAALGLSSVEDLLRAGK